MTEYNKNAVGSVIRRLRKEKKLSQEVVSALAGIARSHLSMIETGVKQANFETLWKIANAFELAPHELIKLIEKECEKVCPDKKEYEKTKNKSPSSKKE